MDSSITPLALHPRRHQWIDALETRLLKSGVWPPCSSPAPSHADDYSVDCLSQKGRTWQTHVIHNCSYYFDTNTRAVFKRNQEIIPRFLRQFTPKDQIPENIQDIVLRYYPHGPKKINGTVASLTALWSSSNYFHWLFDVLPRLHLLQKAALPFRPDFYIIHHSRQSFQLEILKLLQIPDSRILQAHHHIYLSCNRLLLPDPPRPVEIYPPDIEWICAFLRETFLRLATGSSESGKRIYLTRRDTRNGRHILNESELLPILDKWNIHPVCASELTFREQVALFSQAGLVVAPHGAALVNTVFCRPGTGIIEIHNSDYCTASYRTIASHLDLEYHSCPQTPCGTGNPQWANITLNVPEFENLLRKVLSP